MIAQQAKSAAQSGIRRFHCLAFDRGLPQKAGVYLHSLEPEHHAAFIEMCDFFREEGYRFASPDDFLDDPGERCVFVSFDDNYRAWHQAMPLFDAAGVRATFYVNTCAIRERDEAAAIEAYYGRLGYNGPRVPLSGDELRAMADAGHTIGSHTHSHFKLTSIPALDALTDIERGRSDLEAILGTKVDHFAYPYGMRRHFSDDLRAACLAMGFRTIANARPGLQHAPQHPSSLHRSGWDLDRSVEENRQRLSVDGRWFERLTGRSAIA